MKFVLTVILLLLSNQLCATTPACADQPNVILLMTDDQGYPDMSCHGNPVIKTPNMDALAKSSIQFSDFHVNPFCSPTRAALMTGRMSDRTGVTSTNTQRNYLRRNEVIMPEFFRASGYQTAIFGKWHLGANYPYRPMDRGFDHWLGLGNNGLATMADLWDNDRMNDRYWLNGEITEKTGFCTDVYFDEAMAFIKKCKAANQPSFTYLATNVPHWDWNVPKQWLAPYAAECSRERAAFFASITRVDRNMGRLLAFLKEQELESNTILIFLTDNGSDVPDKNKDAYTAKMRGFKGALYEGGHRVPCFFHAPESLVGKPRTIDQFTAHVDLLPTLVDLCGLKTPPNRKPLPWDGRSLKPLLKGQTDRWADRMLIMHHQNGRVPQKAVKSVVMTRDWRLVRPFPKKTDRIELYEIQKDRSQQNNVVAAHPNVVKDLLQKYDQHWKDLRLDRPVERPVASAQATLRLSCDITNVGNPITQQAVRKGLPVKPFWGIEVADSGKYLFEVRRWPREVDVPMTSGLDPTQDPNIEYIGHDNYRIDVPGIALDIEAVKLKLSSVSKTKSEWQQTNPVSENATGVTFEMELTAGQHDLEAWFQMKSGASKGAYFVYIEKLKNE